MSSASSGPQGTVASVWRYPVKSMGGEELEASEVTDCGLPATAPLCGWSMPGSVRSSAPKNPPRKWTNSARIPEPASPSRPGRRGPGRRHKIMTPGGDTLETGQPGFDERISAMVGRPVRLASAAGEAPQIEGYWPDYDWLESRDEVFEVKLPPGTFFDGAVVHLLTTATLNALHALRPSSRFELPRFRPNIVVALPDGAEGFPENDWAGHTLRIGDEVRLAVSEPCPRCVMTTVGQGDLPKDPDILRTIVQRNGGNVGVLASVVQGGRIRRGDPVVVE